MAQATFADVNGAAALDNAENAQLSSLKRKRDAEGDEDMDLGDQDIKPIPELPAEDEKTTINDFVGALET